MRFCRSWKSKLNHRNDITNYVSGLTKRWVIPGDTIIPACGTFVVADDLARLVWPLWIEPSFLRLHHDNGFSVLFYCVWDTAMGYYISIMASYALHLSVHKTEPPPLSPNTVLLFQRLSQGNSSICLWHFSTSTSSFFARVSLLSSQSSVAQLEARHGQRVPGQRSGG